MSGLVAVQSHLSIRLPKGVGRARQLRYLSGRGHDLATRRGGRVVDRAALEMRSTGNRTGGSNPSLSAINKC